MAKNRASALLENLELDLQSGRITEQEWYERVAAVITPAYLAAENPRSQSGHSGNEDQWRHARSLIAEAVHRSGSFLDIGCANGHLMESLEVWLEERGLTAEIFGLDIAPELVDLAKARLPKHADRIYLGNAIDWVPPQRFDFVRTGLEYVPVMKQRAYVEHLLANFLTPNGRLIIGTVNEELVENSASPSTEVLLKSWGCKPAGKIDRPHRSDPRLVYRVVWVDVQP